MKSKPQNKTRPLRANLELRINPVSSITTRKGTLDFKNRTIVMGIVNVTPDSFSDGNRFFNIKIAIKHALEMIQNGADIINDISALNADPEMAGVAAKYKCPVILMHMLGTPQTMQANPAYKDLYGEIIFYLKQSIKKAVKAGVQRRNIIVDPGIGFGKTVEHNLQLIAEMHKLKSLGLPILSGPSRKSFIGKILDLPADQRIEGTAAAVACSIMNGANIVRVHDVKEMVRVARITDAIRRMKNEK